MWRVPACSTQKVSKANDGCKGWGFLSSVCRSGGEVFYGAVGNVYDIDVVEYRVLSAPAAIFAHRPVSAKGRPIKFPAPRKMMIGMVYMLDRHTAAGKAYQQSARGVESRGGIRYKDKFCDDMTRSRLSPRCSMSGIE